MEREVDKFIDSIAKRVYPLTEKEKSCLEKFGKMIINRGHLKKEIIQVISKYEQGEAAGTEKAEIQKEAD